MRQLKITKSITNRESASLDKYLQEIGREELITVEEEVELAQRIRKGDRAALEKLTRANLRFVVSVSRAISVLLRLQKNLMRPAVSNSSVTLYGGFVNQSFRLWLNRHVSFVCPSIR